MNQIEAAFKMLNPCIYDGEAHLGKVPYILTRLKRGVWMYSRPKEEGQGNEILCETFSMDDVSALCNFLPFPTSDQFLTDFQTRFSESFEKLPERIEHDGIFYFLVRLDFCRWGYVALECDSCFVDSGKCKSEMGALLFLRNEL